MSTATNVRPELDDASSTLVEDAVRTLVKAFRAWQLYLPNNPTRERAIATARASFATCWNADVERICLQVREAEFLMDGRVMHRELDRPSDGVPWILYRDGLRELTLLPGFEAEGLEPFLMLLQRARQAAPDEDDLVTMMWVADLETLEYRYVDLAGSYELNALTGMQNTGSNGSSEQIAMPRPPIAAAAIDVPALSENHAPGVVRVEDFDSTLFFLDRRELAYLQEEVRAEFGTDPRREVLAVLFDIIEVQSDPELRAEAIGRVEDAMVDLLASAAYDLAAYSLVEATLTARRAPDLTPGSKQRLMAMTERLSEPSVIEQVLQAVDEGSRAPNPETLEALVAELHGKALAPLLCWVTLSSPGTARASVERAVLKLAERHTSDLVRLLENEDEATATGAVRLSGRLRTAAAVPALGRLLRHAQTARRLEATQALAAIASPGALQLLDHALDDAEREVRVAALRAVSLNKHTAALPKLLAALKRKEMRIADRSEKTALFDAFGAVCGEGGVAVLDGMLNGRSLLGHRETPEVRACAARALGIVATPSALASLKKASSASDAVVRNEVARALRGGGGA